MPEKKTISGYEIDESDYCVMCAQKYADMAGFDLSQQTDPFHSIYTIYEETESEYLSFCVVCQRYIPLVVCSNDGFFTFFDIYLQDFIDYPYTEFMKEFIGYDAEDNCQTYEFRCKFHQFHLRYHIIQRYPKEIIDSGIIRYHQALLPQIETLFSLFEHVYLDTYWEEHETPFPTKIPPWRVKQYRELHEKMDYAIHIPSPSGDYFLL